MGRLCQKMLPDPEDTGARALLPAGVEVGSGGCSGWNGRGAGGFVRVGPEPGIVA